MEYKLGFEKLEIWQLSRELAKKVYEITEGLPLEEKYGLQSQIRRAAVSVSSNIAEGSSRSSLKDQMRFNEIAYGSLMELYNQIILANDFGFIPDQITENLKTDMRKLVYKMNAFRQSLERRS